MNDEETALLKSLGVDESVLEAPIPLSSSNPSSALWRDGFAAAATATVGAALAFNVAILLSLPSVMRGRGAPYLPSQRRSMDSMFKFLRSQPEIRHILQQSQHQRHSMLTGATTSAATIAPLPSSNRGSSGDGRLKFVDLGSGDGRWVFRAAQDHPDLFRVSVGYEINPLLHLYASARRALQVSFRWLSLRPSSDAAPHCSTELHRQDLWTVPLDDANVVAVYGLGPIMKELGAKLERELPPGSYVLSNVFSVPGWEPVAASNASTTVGSSTFYIYQMPQRKSPPSTRRSG